jgi:spore maturation protein CgeB
MTKSVDPTQAKERLEWATPQPSPAGLRILYVAPMQHGSYGLYRRRSLERLGNTLIPVDLMEYEAYGSPLRSRIRYRLQIGRTVTRMNRDVLRLAQEHRVDAVWFDKPLLIRTATLRKLRALGIATIDYMIDNPFGPRRDPGFRLYVRTIPEYDLHVQQRDVSLRDESADSFRAKRAFSSACRVVG